MRAPALDNSIAHVNCLHGSATRCANEVVCNPYVAYAHCAHSAAAATAARTVALMIEPERHSSRCQAHAVSAGAAQTAEQLQAAILNRNATTAQAYH
jgi:hypothetical protein